MNGGFIGDPGEVEVERSGLEQGVGILHKGAPRVSIVVADCADPSQIEVIERAGLNVVLLNEIEKGNRGRRKSKPASNKEPIMA